MASVFPPPLPSGADRVLGGRREVRNQLWGEAVGAGAGQAAARRPRWRSSVIDWSGLMRRDRLSGHRCASPTLQTRRWNGGKCLH